MHRVKPLRDQMLWTLRSFTTARSKLFEDELHAIIVSAMDLDAELNKQVALFQVIVPLNQESQQGYDFVATPGFATIYNDNQPAGSQKVELVVSPALTKSGNSQGEHYDHGDVIVAAQVRIQKSFLDLVVTPQENNNAKNVQNTAPTLPRRPVPGKKRSGESSSVRSSARTVKTNFFKSFQV